MATLVCQVSKQSSGTEIRRTPDQLQAYVAGEDVFIDLACIPSNPPDVERTRGQPLDAAGRNTPHIFVLAAFGLTFAVIGSVAVDVARKPTPMQWDRPSTAPQT